MNSIGVYVKPDRIIDISWTGEQAMVEQYTMTKTTKVLAFDCHGLPIMEKYDGKFAILGNKAFCFKYSINGRDQHSGCWFRDCNSMLITELEKENLQLLQPEDLWIHPGHVDHLGRAEEERKFFVGVYMHKYSKKDRYTIKELNVLLREIKNQIKILGYGKYLKNLIIG